MSYEEYLKTLLAPLGVYDTENGYSAAELFSLGAAMDEASDSTETTERECIVSTAEDFGLLNYEKILPVKPVNRNTDTKREAIAALLRVDDTSFTENALNGILCGCGVPALVTETDIPDTVEVSLPGTKGEPDDMDEIRCAVESILPCHLNVIYRILYVTWEEVEQEFPLWIDLEDAELPWKELERYGSI